MDGEKFLTLAETARVARVSKRTVERMVAAGLLEVVRFGRAVRVPVTALAQYSVPQQKSGPGSGGALREAVSEQITR